MENKIVSVVDGICIPIEQVSDEVFSSKMLGNGFAIIPEKKEHGERTAILSPISGRISGIAESRHAYTIVGEDGLEVLVHIGIDTVDLHGKGFYPQICVGNDVLASDVLAYVEMDTVEKAGHDAVVVVVLANSDQYKGLFVDLGKVKGGETVAGYGKKKDKIAK